MLVVYPFTVTGGRLRTRNLRLPVPFKIVSPRLYHSRCSWISGMKSGSILERRRR